MFIAMSAGGQVYETKPYGGKVYKITRGIYSNYNLLKMNCAIVVRDCLEFALGNKFYKALKNVYGNKATKDKVWTPQTLKKLVLELQRSFC